MTQQEIGNKLIAEFDDDYVNKEIIQDEIDYLQYHTSWDWQVPVAAKAMGCIRQIYLENGGSFNNKEFKILVEEWEKGAINNNIPHSFKMLVNIISALNQYNQNKTT